MSLELVNPYTIKRIETTVVITPNQLNNDLKYHLLMNIKSREENKCNSVGFIKEIISLCDDTINGKLDITNTKGNCKFNLSYIANICIPIANTIVNIVWKFIIFIININHRICNIISIIFF